MSHYTGNYLGWGAEAKKSYLSLCFYNISTIKTGDIIVPSSYQNNETYDNITTLRISNSLDNSKVCLMNRYLSYII